MPRLEKASPEDTFSLTIRKKPRRGQNFPAHPDDGDSPLVQIIGLLLCVYLVVKGFEFLHRRQCSSRTEVGWGFSITMFLLCMAAAAFFAFALLLQGSEVSNLPRFR